jgi:hypothetical protein
LQVGRRETVREKLKQPFYAGLVQNAIHNRLVYVHTYIV